MALVLREIVERFFDVDKGWLRTARDLTLGHGAMIRRYVQGHRKVYANPFAYLGRWNGRKHHDSEGRRLSGEDGRHSQWQRHGFSTPVGVY